MNRLGKILTLGLERKRAWQLRIIVGFRGPRTGSSSVARGASPLDLRYEKKLHPGGVE